MAEQDDDDGWNRPLMGLVVILVIAVIGLFVIKHLKYAAALQDCVIEGRRNCDKTVME